MVEVFFKIPIYNFKVKLALVESVEDYTKTSHELGDYRAVVVDTADEKDHSALVIFTNSGIRPNTIAHEAFHIVCLVAKHIGIQLNDSSEEAYAYLLDWLVRQLTINLINLKQIKNGNTD